MKREEYITTVVFNGNLINVGLDDYGQTYFIEYAEDGKLKEECVGSYIKDYEDYIEYKFGTPEINCPVYNDVAVGKVCEIHNKIFCTECRKFYNDIDWEALQHRREEFEKWSKENRPC